MPDRHKADLARRVGAKMYAADHAAHALGITLDEIAPGRARMTMRVRPDMLNSHGICHGGLTYALCDVSFAYACNSHNMIAVASGCDILYPAAARLDDVLTVVCEERHMRGRNGVYDATVTTQTGEVVALFRGQSRRLDGHHVAPAEA